MKRFSQPSNRLRPSAGDRKVKFCRNTNPIIRPGCIIHLYGWCGEIRRVGTVVLARVVRTVRGLILDDFGLRGLPRRQRNRWPSSAPVRVFRRPHRRNDIVAGGGRQRSQRVGSIDDPLGWLTLWICGSVVEWIQFDSARRCPVSPICVTRKPFENGALPRYDHFSSTSVFSNRTAGPNRRPTRFFPPPESLRDEVMRMGGQSMPCRLARSKNARMPRGI